MPLPIAPWKSFFTKLITAYNKLIDGVNTKREKRKIIYQILLAVSEIIAYVAPEIFFTLKISKKFVLWRAAILFWVLYQYRIGGCSSAGRARRSQCRGLGFD